MRSWYRIDMLSDSRWDVVVIGGGPAGMMAAGRAAERGRRVLLLEKNPTLGKKLLITGGGRCNVTNNKPDVHTMLATYKTSNKFLFSAFTQFGVLETLDFFHERGMHTKEELEGRVFPSSNKAQSVWDVLVQYMKKNNVTIQTNTTVVGIDSDKKTGEIQIRVRGASSIRSHSIVIATGGTSHPETGSTGEGFRWLKSLGHTVAQNDLSLVPIALKDAWVKCAGVTLKDIKLTLLSKGAKKSTTHGKLLFTHVGMSGPTVLNISREVGDALQGGEVVIMLDLFPALDSPTLKEKLQALLIEQSNKKIKNALSQLIPPALVEPLLALADVSGETPNHSVRSEQRKALVALLKAIPLHVAGLLGKDKAIVSSGGVALSEVNFKTMQSRLVPNLFLAGDVLNIDRPSGGYSLQLCWTTGYVAGNNC